MTKAASEDHPIKRIRREFKKLSKESGMRHLSAAQQFARWVGCSESLIRNVETGQAQFSKKLAKSIEKKTGVSAEWMLGNPESTEPIRDVDDQEWSPKWIDVFSAHPDLGLLYRICPSLLPRVIAKLIEAQLRLDFYDGKRGNSVGLLQRLFRSGMLRNDEIQRPIHGKIPRSREFHEQLAKSIGDDDAFSEKYLDCLNRMLDDSPTRSNESEKALHYLKGLEPEPEHGSQIAKLMDDRLEPQE